jgi:hypothetical protein
MHLGSVLVHDDARKAGRCAPAFLQQSAGDGRGFPRARHICKNVLVRATRGEGSVDEESVRHPTCQSASVSRFVGGNDAGGHPPPVAHRHSFSSRPSADCLRLPGRRDIGSRTSGSLLAGHASRTFGNRFRRCPPSAGLARHSPLGPGSLGRGGGGRGLPGSHLRRALPCRPPRRPSFAGRRLAGRPRAHLGGLGGALGRTLVSCVSRGLLRRDDLLRLGSCSRLISLTRWPLPAVGTAENRERVLVAVLLGVKADAHAIPPRRSR